MSGIPCLTYCISFQELVLQELFSQLSAKLTLKVWKVKTFIYIVMEELSPFHFLLVLRFVADLC